VTTLTSNATLSSSNYKKIAATAPAPASLCTFYRSAETGSKGIRGDFKNIGTALINSGTCTFSDTGMAGTIQDPHTFVSGGLLTPFLNGAIILDGCLDWNTYPRNQCTGDGLRQAQLDARVGQFGGKVYIPSTGSCGSRDSTPSPNGCPVGGVQMGCKGITLQSFDNLWGCGPGRKRLGVSSAMRHPNRQSITAMYSEACSGTSAS